MEGAVRIRKAGDTFVVLYEDKDTSRELATTMNGAFAVELQLALSDLYSSSVTHALASMTIEMLRIERAMRRAGMGQELDEAKG